MKKILLLTIITIFYGLNVTAQSVTISGKVAHFNRKKIVLKGFNYNKKIKFDKKTGEFSKKIKNLETGVYTLAFKRRLIPIYLESGKKLHIEFDMKDRASLPVFSGDNVTVNNYLSERKGVFISTLGSANGLFSSDEEEFLDKMHNFKYTLLELLEESNLPASFVEYEKRNINYGYVRNIQNYQEYHTTLNRLNNFKVSKDFPDFSKSIDYNRGRDYKLSLDYRMLIRDQFHKIASKAEEKGEDYTKVYIDKICDEIINQTIKDDLLYDLLLDNLVYSYDPVKIYQKFKDNCKDKEKLEEITTLFEKLEKITKGNKSPKFKNFTNLEGGKTSFDDVVGKKEFTCIYFWATWCKYCKNELALVSKLSEKYDMSKIQFLGVNVDRKNKINKWKKMIKNYKLVGEHVFSGKIHTKLDFAKEYLVLGVPRFILLDKEGKIISFNVPRPSPENDGEKFINFMKKEGAIK